MKYIVILLFSITQLALAQQEKTFTHVVQANETINSIAKKYKISENDILKLNLGAQNGIQEKTVLLIPNPNSVSYLLKKNDVAATNYQQHQVTQKETLYSIAKQYDVSINQLQLANAEILVNGLKEGQILVIPNNQNVITPTTSPILNVTSHEVQSKETLFSIARQYNVSVKDLEEINTQTLAQGLKIGQIIQLPNKKKTLSGSARIINNETLFHTVLPKETKYAIAKKYKITIAQLEKQNPEIINSLAIGNKLAINTSAINAKNENEELMIALAEKQEIQEKNKIQIAKIEDLEDRLIVQKELNKKMITLNKLNINLNSIDETKTGSVEKLKLILDANKQIQEVLILKLDSLASTMENDLQALKDKDIETLEESKNLEKQSYQNIQQTNTLLTQLKQDLAESRKVYTNIMHKVQRITVQENKELKKKVHQNLTDSDKIAITAINKLSQAQVENENKNQQLLVKINSIESEKKSELQRKISKATFYSTEAREYDDKLALVKLQRYQKKLTPETDSPIATITEQEIQKNNNSLNNNTHIKIEVIKNLKNLTDGYYIIANTFTDTTQRDAFALQLSQNGELKTAFFYNVNNLSYYVYTNITATLTEATHYCQLKQNNPLFNQIFIVHIQKE